MHDNGQLDWTGVLKVIPDRLSIPKRWKRPRRIFVDSQSDLFHEEVPFRFLLDVWNVMAECEQHLFQILTKRAHRLYDALKWIYEYARHLLPADAPLCRAIDAGRWPLENVHLGVSIEDGNEMKCRMLYLLQSPASFRYVSFEPLLERVDPADIVNPEFMHWWKAEELSEDFPIVLDAFRGRMARYNADGKLLGEIMLPRIDLAIVGGESGPNPREMDLSWARTLRDRCMVTGVLCHIKQMGTVWARRMNSKTKKGDNPEEWPQDLRMQELPDRRSPCTSHAN